MTDQFTGLCRPAFLLVSLLATLLVASAGCASSEENPTPEFELTLYERGEESGPPTLKLVDLEGEPRILNFWAEWCAPCRREMPALEATYRKYRQDGLVMVGVDMGVSFDPADPEITGFLDEVGVTYPVGFSETGDVAAHYEVTGLPATLFIGQDGSVVRKWLGEISEDELAEMTSSLVSN